MEAAGLLHNTPRLVVMPDDPALGEFRADFKGQAGDIEEFVGQKGYGGALEIIGGEEMWKRLDAGPETQVDSRAYLAVRLVDQLIGDWDRHREQWLWARMPGKTGWQPLPEDRDQAFARFQGLMAMMLRQTLPLLVDFKDKYSSMHGLTFDSWDVDRRLLSGLGAAAYDEVARELQRKLSDAVIEAAVRRMPAEWFAMVGEPTIAALKQRRDRLPEQARRLYRFFVNQVDVRASEQDDAVLVERFDGGDVLVRVALLASPDAPYYERRFSSRETDEVRISLLSGNDRVTSRGPRGGITVRVIGGAGNDSIDDSASGGLRVADAEGRTQLERGPGTVLDDDPYRPPPPSGRGAWIPARDWGRRTLFPLTRVSGSTDLGIVLTVGLHTTGYGFRKHPYASAQSFQAGYSSLLKEFRGDYDGRFPLENSRLEARLQARASGLEVVRFYGFGNETSETLDKDAYRVHQNQYGLAPSLSLSLGKRSSASLGAVLKRVTTEAEPGTVVAALQPYGVEDTTQIGLRAGLTLDATNRVALPTRGVRLQGGGTFYPATIGLQHSFGEVHGDAAVFLTAGATLALRASGKRLFGTYPFYEAASLGGPQNVRGLRLDRYAGDGMLHGSAELFLPLKRIFKFVPGEVGLLGTADTGRVFVEGEDSSVWHEGYGGGLYFASPLRNNLIGLLFARSEGHNAFYLRLGLVFQ
jgi:hypothetical protein